MLEQELETSNAAHVAAELNCAHAQHAASSAQEDLAKIKNLFEIAKAEAERAALETNKIKSALAHLERQKE